MKQHFSRFLVGGACILILLSCSSSSSNNNSDINLGNYESLSFKIDSKNTTSPLYADQYQVDSISPMITPDNVGNFEATKVFVNDKKIYVLDTKVTNTILVFNLKGQYLYKLGEIGRAKNEYISAPEDFFVAKNGDVHVFDEGGQKILTFNDNGAFIKSTDVQWTQSFGLTSDNKYLRCLDNRDMPDEKPDPSLLIYDPISKSQEPLIPSKHFQCYFLPNLRTFFYNDERLSHVPLLSDSVVVFKDKAVEKVVRFEFTNGFLPKDKPEWVRFPADGGEPLGSSVDYDDFPGVVAIYDYQETESHILMNYIDQSGFVHWLYNKHTMKIIHNNKLFAGINLFNKFFLKGNQIIGFVGKENVEMLKEYCESEEFDEEEYKKTPSFVKAFQSGKLSAPALVYITVK